MPDEQTDPETQTAPQETTLPIPLILEAARTLAKVMPIVVALIVFGLSLASGAAPLTVGLRVAGALLLADLVGWLFIYLLAQSLLWLLGTLTPKPAPAPATSTQSWEA